MKKIEIKKTDGRKLAVSAILSLLITFMQVAGWQISMDYGSSVHRSAFFQRIGVLEVWQCILWGLTEWLLLSALFYLLFGWLGNRRMKKAGEQRSIRHLWLYVFLVLLAIWYFFLWGCYPGYYNYDVGNQLVQVLYDEVPYNAHHPLLHTLFSGGLITLGYTIDSTDLTLGVFLDNLVQMLLLAICLTYSLRYLYNMTRNILLTVFSCGFYALCPPIVMFAMSPTKDVLCYGVLLVAVIRLRELYRSLQEERQTKPGEWLMAGVLLTLSSLLRKNIIYAVAAFAVCSLLILRRERIRQLLLFFGVLLVYLVVDKGLLMALDAEPASVNEALCAPYQAMARLYVEEGAEAFTEEEYELLSEIIPPDNLTCYDPIIADNIKSNFNPGLETLLEHKQDYVGLWVKKCAEYLNVYLEALLYNTYQAWYPGTLIMDNKGVRYFDITGWDDEYNTPNWQGLYDFYQDVRWGAYADYPLVRLLFVPGTMLWILLVAWFFGIWCRDKSTILALLLVLLVCGTTFLGPVSDVRYYLILFYLAPVCLGLLSEKRENRNGSESVPAL